MSSTMPSTMQTNAQPKLELISFKLCPFVQRAVVVLKHKNVDFDITYIDLNEPPEWFKAISPLGQVPVLKVMTSAGTEVLFESAVIQEYVDEITPPSLHPADALIKAKNRAWISFGGEILGAMHGMISAKEEAACNDKRAAVQQRLARLEAAHSGGDYFNGADFNLIDAAYAPMLMRLDFIKQLTGEDLLADTPKLAHWSSVLLALPSVQNSVVEGLVNLYAMMLKKLDGHFACKLKPRD
ncbi:glutathione S-transferase family protein [Thiomicrorhabdus cannonii]|uniref:glutathione S-transferase family protein n=1 Tax=Thiomicrorhabdus cannonii TaxID=2748011 RepID=UPI001FE97EA1|nr:glutathione S-transferase family protein [Thiomicrorhabdus cannonii]